jgi:hypothetical protein
MHNVEILYYMLSFHSFQSIFPGIMELLQDRGDLPTQQKDSWWLLALSLSQILPLS